MEEDKHSLKERKVITIGIVSELTGLTVRQIRYYEERKLIFPDRSNQGSRKFSFSDVETLMEIANKIEEGVQTHEIRREMAKKKKGVTEREVRDRMLKGQIRAQFGDPKM
ncbi:MerR family transcriptional regulator [Pontibacillus yanchengensis]|uniref:MerR family transcriptional regulator n=2 Tax=Pontibacillus yanchengensis TaxID=462910 RepID=A0ACC7VJM6_9BACI|nr:MerR family transcriptional regulator [Pontibacillus yanchengensis]MYL35980.1 MerR family transcriptional regulator [Pontibacillus yanchengensis]MYL54376.1 MerR family transcriptional regulator [Pontibacillus yanchengensis]